MIQRLNHPDREIYIYTLDFQARTPRCTNVKMRRHISS